VRLHTRSSVQSRRTLCFCIFHSIGPVGTSRFFWRRFSSISCWWSRPLLSSRRLSFNDSVSYVAPQFFSKSFPRLFSFVLRGTPHLSALCQISRGRSAAVNFLMCPLSSSKPRSGTPVCLERRWHFHRLQADPFATRESRVPFPFAQ